MSNLRRRETSTLQVFVIIFIFAGWFIYASILAVTAGFPPVTFNDSALLGVVQFEFFAFFAAAMTLAIWGWSLDDFKFSVSWRGTFIGLALYIATLPAYALLWFTSAERLSGIQFLDDASAHASLSYGTIFAVSLANGLYEEFFLTKYLIDALHKHGAWFAIGLSTLVRVSYHLYQGPFGAISVLIYGVIVTLFYWRFRMIWPVMFAHIVADIAAFVTLTA